MLLQRHIFKTTSAGLNMGAMIDVVFLLLIFFMCTTSFQSPEDRLPVQIPYVGGVATQPEDFEPIRIRLYGAAEGIRLTCDQQNCATFTELKTRLRARRAIADIPVIISGQDEVPFEHMVAALDSCYEVDLSQAAFSTGQAVP